MDEEPKSKAESSNKITFSDFQQLIRDMYIDRDVERGVDLGDRCIDHPDQRFGLRRSQGGGDGGDDASVSQWLQRAGKPHCVSLFGHKMCILHKILAINCS